VTTHEVPYDVGSIMHYGSNYFSKNQLPTITTKDPSKAGLLGNLEALTFNDIKLANIIYDCNEDCDAEIVCLNGGYQGPNCDCVCPLGFGGAFCHESDGTVDPPVGPVSGCSYTFTDAVGEITSENYPNNYPDLIDCTYTIKGGEGASITIVFREFDLEDHATCDYDYLNVRSEGVAGDGSTYCGDQLPPVHYTYSNEMVLTFHSDPFVNGQGFRVTYFINGDLVDEEEEEEEETMTTVLPTTTTVVPTTATVTTTTNIPTTESESDGEFVGTCGGYFGSLGEHRIAELSRTLPEQPGVLLHDSGPHGSSSGADIPEL